MKILINNAYEAWIRAIECADLLSQGFATLGLKKEFISSLHNAIELFFKQIMINQCDYRVIPCRKRNAGDSLYKEFLNSSDLNQYFKVNSDKASEFISLNFQKIIEIHREVLADYLKEGETFQNQLKELQKLRNAETHFFISDDKFLIENQFIPLYNFMVEWNDVLIFYKLIPQITDEDSLIYEKCYNRPLKFFLNFERQKLESFTYLEALKDSELFKIVKELNDVKVEDDDNLDSLELAYEYSKRLDISIKSSEFKKVYGMVQMLNKYRMFEYTPSTIILDCLDDEDGNSFKLERSYRLKAKLVKIKEDI